MPNDTRITSSQATPARGELVEAAQRLAALVRSHSEYFPEEDYTSFVPVLVEIDRLTTPSHPPAPATQAAERVEAKWQEIRTRLNEEYRQGIITYRELKHGINYAAMMRDAFEQAEAPAPDAPSNLQKTQIGPAPSGAEARAERGRVEEFLSQLRRVNGERAVAWLDGSPSDPLFWAIELGGEVGEILNVVEKLHREELGWKGSRASLDDLADEIADGIICLDSLARHYGIDLAQATAAKFNKTSEKVGFPHRLAALQPSTTAPENGDA